MAFVKEKWTKSIYETQKALQIIAKTFTREVMVKILRQVEAALSVYLHSQNIVGNVQTKYLAEKTVGYILDSINIWG